MKPVKFNRKTLFTALLALAIIASTFVMAAPVSAAAFDLTVAAGGTSATILAADFNAMSTISMNTAYANANYSRNVDNVTTPVGTYDVIMTTQHNIYGFKAGESVTIKNQAKSLQETNIIASIDPTTRKLTMTNPLANDYANGTVNAVMVYDTWVGVPVKNIIDTALGTSYDGTGYSIVAFGSDGYPVMAGPTSTGTNIDTTGANTIMIAKSKDGIAVTGGGTLACTDFTSSSQFGSGTAKIELVYAQKVTWNASSGNVTTTGWTWWKSTGNKQGPDPWANYGVIPVSLPGSSNLTNPTYHLSPNSSNIIKSVVADSTLVVPAPPTYSFSTLTVNHTLAVTFGLPAVNVSISPSSQAVANGATFNVNLAITTDTASRGWQANVDFDASKLTANTVTEGGFLHDWAVSNNDSTVSGGSMVIDNVGGHITGIAYAITGTANLGGPSGSGTLCTISFTAKPSVNNITNITIPSAVVSDVNAVSMPGVTLTGGQVNIGVALPDLIVSAASTARVDSTDNYTITYTITNQGNVDDTIATVTSIVIDGGTPITVGCPALAAGASDTKTISPETVSGASDTIVITADSTNVVTEGNESNNTATIIYAKTGDTGTTIVNGNIAAAIAFTAPTNIDPWNLVVGSNDISGNMNVKCNSNWQVQVSDQNAITAGHMTKWMSNTYDPSTKLAAPLTVGCLTSVDLSGTPQSIVTGTPSGQVGNNGQDCTVLFHQAILYADAILTGGYSYHIVVTFTASVTF